MMDGSLLNQPLAAVDTPALVVDYDLLMANIQRLQTACDAAGLQLRPHIKAHKTPEVAHLQLQAGAVGVTAAKLGEAEVMATAGVPDIFIANQIVGETKLRRLVALARRVPKLSVAVDSLEVAAPMSEALTAAGQTLDILIEVDHGAARCGVPPEETVAFAQALAPLQGLRLVGLMAYAARSYVGDWEQRRAFCRQEGAELAALAGELRAAGFPITRLSGGSTPAGPCYEPNCGLTEIRSGTYCLNDHNQVDLGTCTRAEVAATVLATVISRPAPDRAILDAGTKALDQQVGKLTAGYGWLLDPPDANVVKINDEHGYLDERGASLRVGDKVRIIPPRICTCLNLYDWMVVVQEGRVRDIWRIAARGRNT
jgi:D-serine deaminase-like pyridoxal phosphate-dependent protein